MLVIHLIKYGIWRVLEKICFKFNIYAFIKTRYGLKNVNINLLYGNNKIDSNSSEVISINPRKLFLGVDFLKDKYTLLNCCIIDSPHYGFMEAIASGKNIKKTDYYNRFITGKLDGRHSQRDLNLSYFYSKNEKAKQSIERGDYKPVVIYSWKNRFYIFDGKHRAALCAMMNKDVKCKLVSPNSLFLSISDFGHAAINKEIYRIIAEDKQYSQHINFFKDGEE